jgi:hypothetical protein
VRYISAAYSTQNAFSDINIWSQDLRLQAALADSSFSVNRWLARLLFIMKQLNDYGAFIIFKINLKSKY